MTDSNNGLDIDADGIGAVLQELGGANGRVRIDPETVEQDLARLVLALMEFLRQLMELQAIRRMENGSLSLEQEEALGTTLQRAEAAIHDMAGRFGLSPGDLSLDLGPLGRTV
ncbi:MAG: gas vesicle protein K [Roseicyclus sp.]